jgi:hypothetical protein
MAETYQDEKTTPIIAMSVKQIMQVAVLGILVGLLVWAFTYILETYILKALLCQGSQTMKCALATNYAGIAASILAAGVGLFGLVKIGIFRPLLVVIAATVSLWGLLGIIGAMPLYGVLIFSAGLTALSYIAYSWIARIRLFWLAVLLMVVLIVVVRLVLMS